MSEIVTKVYRSAQVSRRAAMRRCTTTSGSQKRTALIGDGRETLSVLLELFKFVIAQNLILSLDSNKKQLMRKSFHGNAMMNTL